MDDAELFDVFAVEETPVVQVPNTVKTKKHKKEKKKASNQVEDEPITNKRALERAANEDESATHKVKKQRKTEPQPIIVDSFETESDQIVPATQGLQGVPLATDQNIVIKKRVPPPRRSKLTL
jgi:hypothetical protein